jgi:hypothetical protein
MVLTVKEFSLKSELHGAYVFVFEDACPLCKMHTQSLTNRGVTDYNTVRLREMVDVDWLKETFEVDSLPHTVIYKKNKLIWEKNNLFFNRQIKELKENMAKV